MNERERVNYSNNNNDDEEKKIRAELEIVENTLGFNFGLKNYL